jgi:hypothetical protein
MLVVGIFAAGPADAPLASDNDNPAAALSIGAAFLKRLRFETGLTCDIVAAFHTLGILSLVDLRVLRLDYPPAFLRNRRSAKVEVPIQVEHLDTIEVILGQNFARASVIPLLDSRSGR